MKHLGTLIGFNALTVTSLILLRIFTSNMAKINRITILPADLLTSVVMPLNTGTDARNSGVRDMLSSGRKD